MRYNRKARGIRRSSYAKTRLRERDEEAVSNLRVTNKMTWFLLALGIVGFVAVILVLIAAGAIVLPWDRGKIG